MARIILFGIAVSFGLALGPASAQSPLQPRLQLTSEVLEQTFCSKDDAITLRLKLRLRYTNASSQRIIIYKGHDLFYQTKIRRAPLPERPSYEVHLLNMHYFDEEFERIQARSPSKVFVTLAPNQSFERELIAGIGVENNSETRTGTSVNPGVHNLYLIVSTWYQSPQLAEQLRQQWQRKGYLWSQPLVSAPIRIDIQRPTFAPPCR